MARLIARMNDVALRPNAVSSAPRAFTNAATLSRARAIIASTSRECRYGPPRWTLRETRWPVPASSTRAGICAPAALSKKTNPFARSSAGNCRRRSSTGNLRTGAPPCPRVDHGHHDQERQERRHRISQPVHEERRRGNGRERDDAEHRGRAVRGHPDRQLRDLCWRERRAKSQVRKQDDNPDEEHAGDGGAVEREERLARRVHRE